MSTKLFTNEEINILNDNPYVKKLSRSVLHILVNLSKFI